MYDVSVTRLNIILIIPQPFASTMLVQPGPLSDSDLVAKLADAILADESADDVDLAAILQSEVESLVNGIVSSPSLPSFGTTTRVS